MFKGGQPVDGFVGALPEAEIREFLDKHVPSAEELASDEDLLEAEELLAEGDTGSAIEKLRGGARGQPGQRHRPLRLPARTAAGRAHRGGPCGPEPVGGRVIPDPRLCRLPAVAGRLRPGRQGAPGCRSAGCHRRQQARLRSPPRTGPNPLCRTALHRGDGRAARDHHARQGLARRTRPPHLRGRARGDGQAGRTHAESRPGRSQGHAGAGRQDHHRPGGPGDRQLPTQAEHGAVLPKWYA
jgi:hypothetical protein